MQTRVIRRADALADQNNWLELLDGAVMAINNSTVAPTGKSPFEIESGLPMKTPIDVQPIAHQTRENHGNAALVRDTMLMPVIR